MTSPRADRLRRRGTALAAASLALLGNLGLAFGGHGFFGLLVGRFFVGLGSGVTFCSASAWLVDVDPAASAQRTPMSMASGFGSGPLVAGLVATGSGGSLVLPYEMHAVALLAALGLVVAATTSSRGRAADSAVRTTPAPASAASPMSGRSFVLTVLLVAPRVFVFPTLGFLVLPQMTGGGAPPSSARWPPSRSSRARSRRVWRAAGRRSPSRPGCSSGAPASCS